jgi:hypothetical protein
LARNSKNILNRSGESEHPRLIPDFRGHGFSFSQLNVMLGIGLSYIAFITLSYIPFSAILIRAFIMKWCWILLKDVSASVEMIKWFLSSLLVIYCITFNDTCMLNHPYISGMEPTFMVNDLFDMLLDLVWHYFIAFCINIH